MFQAYKELGLLVLLVGVAVLTFSSLVFYAEKDSKEFSWTFIDSFWWGLMTLTTGKIYSTKQQWNALKLPPENVCFWNALASRRTTHWPKDRHFLLWALMQGANHFRYNSLCILRYKCRKAQVRCEQFWFKKWLFLKVKSLKNHFKIGKYFGENKKKSWKYYYILLF